MSDEDASATRRTVAPRPLGVFVLILGGAAALSAFLLGEAAALVAGFLLGFVCVGLLQSLRPLRGLTAAIDVPSRVLAARPFPLSATLRGDVAARDVVVQVGTSLDARWTVGYVAWLLPGTPRRFTCRHRIAGRGRVDALWLSASTTFPFGLFEVAVTRRLDVDLVVLPAVNALRGLDRRLAAAARSETRRARRRHRGDEEFRSLRRWRPGESRRMVAQKASARRGVLLIRELDDPRPTSSLVMLDRRVAARSNSFELAVRLAASVVSHLATRGQRVRLGTVGSGGADGPPVIGRRTCHDLLEVLAVVQSDAARSESPPASPAPGERVIWVRAGGGRATSDAPDGCCVLDVDDRDTRRWMSEHCGFPPLWSAEVPS